MKKDTKAPSVAGSVWFHPDIPQTQVIQFVRNEKNISKQDSLLDYNLQSGGDDKSHIFAFHFLLEKRSKKAQYKIVDPILQRLEKNFPGLLGKKIRWSMSTTIDID